MIKSFLSSKILSAASGECVVIGVKLADTETHAVRLFGFFLLLVSVVVLIHEWHHKAAHTEAAQPASLPVTRSAKKAKRSHKNRARR